MQSCFSLVKNTHLLWQHYDALHSILLVYSYDAAIIILAAVLPQLEIEIRYLSSKNSLDFDKIPRIHILSPNVDINLCILQACCFTQHVNYCKSSILTDQWAGEVLLVCHPAFYCFVWKVLKFFWILFIEFIQFSWILFKFPWVYSDFHRFSWISLDFVWLFSVFLYFYFLTIFNCLKNFLKRPKFLRFPLKR